MAKCDNWVKAHKTGHPILAPACDRGQASVILEVIYSESCFGKDSDTLHLCTECAMRITLDAEGRGYKVVPRSLDGVLRLTREQWERFKALWHSRGDQLDFLALAQEVNPRITAKEWDRAWQWCTVLHPDYAQAHIEFMMAINGNY